MVVRFAPRFIGRTLRVRAEAGDADGNAQDEELAALAVLAPPVGLDPLRIAPRARRGREEHAMGRAAARMDRTDALWPVRT